MSSSVAAPPRTRTNLASAWRATLAQQRPADAWVVDVAFAETQEGEPQFFVVETTYEATRRCVAVRRFAEFRRLLKAVQRCDLGIEAPFPSRTAVLSSGLSGKPSAKALTRRLEGLGVWLSEVAARRASLDDAAAKVLRQFVGAEDGWDNDEKRPPMSPPFSPPPHPLPPSPVDDEEDEQCARDASRLTAAALQLAELEGQRDAALLRCRELELEVANEQCRASDAEQANAERAAVGADGSDRDREGLLAELNKFDETLSSSLATLRTREPNHTCEMHYGMNGCPLKSAIRDVEKDLEDSWKVIREFRARVDKFEAGRYQGCVRPGGPVGLSYQEQRQHLIWARQSETEAHERRGMALQDILRLEGALTALGERFEAAVTTATAALDATKAETLNDAERQNLAYALKEAAAARDDARKFKGELAALEEKYVEAKGYSEYLEEEYSEDPAFGEHRADLMKQRDDARRKLTVCARIRDEDAAASKALAEKASEKVEAAERGRDDAVNARQLCERERDEAVRGRENAERERDAVVGQRDDARRKLTACERARDEATAASKALAEKSSEKVEAAERGRDDAVRERDAAVSGLTEGKRLWDEEVQKRAAAETGRGEASAARDEAEQEVARLEAALKALGTRFEAADEMASNFLEASKTEASTLKTDLRAAARAKKDAETARRALAADPGVASAARDALQGELAETIQDRDALAAERLDAVAALAASRTAGYACAARLAALEASIVVPPPPPNPPQTGCAPGCFG